MSKLRSYIQGLPLPHGGTFEVLRWESTFLRGIEGTDGDAALSVARGNGKSALVAGIAAATVDPEGPLHGPGFEVLVSAATFEQATIVFTDTLHYLGDRYDLGERGTWRKQQSANKAELEHRPTGAKVRCIGSNPQGAHGARPRLILADEPAQWSTPDAMLAVHRTSLGKVPGSRLIGLGTRSADEGHWWSKALAGGFDYVQVHAADPEDPPFQRRTWKKANPSLDHLPELEKRIRKEAVDAKKDPALLAGFRALRLNQGVSDVLQQTLRSTRRTRRTRPSSGGPGRKRTRPLTTFPSWRSGSAKRRSTRRRTRPCWPASGRSASTRASVTFCSRPYSMRGRGKGSRARRSQGAGRCSALTLALRLLCPPYRPTTQRRACSTPWRPSPGSRRSASGACWMASGGATGTCTGAAS